MNKNSYNLNDENIKNIEIYTNKYLEQNISSYLYKLQIYLILLKKIKLN